MKIGLSGGFSQPIPDHMVMDAIASEAERYGFESIWGGEHALWFDTYRRPYPYTSDGRLPMPPGSLEPLIALSYLAGRTTTLRLATGVLLIPQRNPIYAAQQVATLDHLSGGRVILGVGLGWQIEECEALQVPWNERARRFDEYLEIMRVLWTEDAATFAGEFWSFEDARQFPKPLQTPHPPIHVSGNSDAALRRVARWGQGWYGLGLTPEAVVERITRLDEFLDEYGRSLGEIELTVSYQGQLEGLARDVAAYRQAGVHRLTVRFDSSCPETVQRSLAELAISVDLAGAETSRPG